ncbi:MAG: AMP-binding protein, partial [Clostridia bacterium]|nr:AMP-binding protein [Clostridia bacterium]
ECAPLAIINHDRLRTTDSIGQPLPGVQAKIINRDENGVGEVCVKGDMVMLGYYNNPEATAEVMDADGFFHTGDLGFVDRKGNYHLTGRCKNVIVTSNGKNIYPEELEYHINASDVVAASMVEGVENKNGEVRVHAQLLPDLEELEERIGRKPSPEEINRAMKDVIDQVNAQLPGFKRIRTFTVRSKEFVMTTTQKIKRESNKS